MLKYKTSNNKIIIESSDEFDIKQTLECGQIFSYKKIDENKYGVFSINKQCVIEQNNSGRIVITTKDVDYFISFFDLQTDYTAIKQKLYKYEVMRTSIKNCGGIRILKQNIFETIISFVISANNNIKRITNSVFVIRGLGDSVFLDINILLKQDLKFFIDAGLGYRASQIVKLLKQLQNVDLDGLKKLNTQDLKNYLISLSGIGPKVADCILLFGFSRYDVFPVDTWIKKVYNENFEKCDIAPEISKRLVAIFGDLSGFAQQYLFYNRRLQKK